MTDIETSPVEILILQETSPVKILILQRGWVIIGRHSKVDVHHVLTGASVIRRWGTQRGVGQLAVEGPQPGTILDFVGTCKIHELTTVLVIDVDAEKWGGVL